MGMSSALIGRSSRLTRFVAAASSAFLCTVIVAGSFAIAEGKKKELPPRGALASSSTSGYGARAQELPWGDVDISGKGASPVSGSVSRASATTWVVKLFNNSKDQYSVSCSFVQLGKKGERITGSAISATLKPGGKYEQVVPMALNAVNTSLNLDSWKRFETKKKEGKGEGKGVVPPSGSAPESSEGADDLASGDSVQ